MEWFRELVFGTGIAHSILLLALVIAVGAALAKIKVAGVSLGMTWILFVGIVASHFGLVLDPVVLGFIRDFGLIVFIFAVGMQVGPSFFSSFRKGGLKLNGFAVLSIALSVGIALILCKVADVKLTTMTGILCGAVTNTPGLGAAQEAYHDATGVSDPSIAMGYAVAYPLGVIGIILSMILLRVIFRVNIEAENKRLEEARRDDPSATNTVSVKVTNPVFSGKKIADMKKLCTNRFVISRIMHPDGTVDIAAGHSVINLDDVLYMVVSAKDSARVASFIGEEVTVDDDKWREENQKYVSRRIVITKPQINGRYLGDLKLRNNFGVNVVRVNRAGIDLAATANLQLQMGDRLTVVGEEAALQDVANMLGNQLKRLRHPNIIPIFVCLLLGALLGSIPFYFGNIPQPVKPRPRRRYTRGRHTRGPFRAENPDDNLYHCQCEPHAEGDRYFDVPCGRRARRRQRIRGDDCRRRLEVDWVRFHHHRPAPAHHRVHRTQMGKGGFLYADGDDGRRNDRPARTLLRLQHIAQRPSGSGIYDGLSAYHVSANYHGPDAYSACGIAAESGNKIAGMHGKVHPRLVCAVPLSRICGVYLRAERAGW